MATVILGPWHLGYVVQNLMDAAGIETNGELAERAGVAMNTISALLRGKNVDPETKEKVAGVFGMSRLDLERQVDDLNQGRGLRLASPPPPPDDSRTRGLSDDAIFMARRFDELTKHRQAMMIGMLNLLRLESPDEQNGNNQ